jgi:hypothetical protein
MRLLLLALPIVFLSALDLHCAPLQPNSNAFTKELGLNLSSVSFWTPEIVFVDAFKQSHPWVSQMPGKEWNKGGPLSLSKAGWIEKLNDSGHFVETLMFVDLQGHYPAGDYICLYDGTGELDFGQAGKVTQRKPGRLVVKVTPKDGPIAMRLLKTDPDNPVRNIRVLLPGFEDTYAEKPFHPDFLKRWEGFKVIRFMDWGMTNNSKIEKWRDRSNQDDPSQATEKGVALEYQILLANTLNADPWFCIPHLANDEFVRNFAELIKSKLNHQRKIYLEYSNECWHGGFAGGRYCAAQGAKLELSKDHYEGQLRYYSQRSVEIFKIVQDVLGGNDRLVRIMSTQPESTWAIRTVLDWKNAAKNVDAVAIAPYFGIDLGKPTNAEKTSKMTVDEVLNRCKKEIETNAKRTKDIANAVKERGLKLLAYEGGQHLVGVEGAENNEKLMNLFHAANRDPKMRDLYLQDLQNWAASGGGFFCIYSSMTRYNKWGSWGVLEYADQDEKTAPKLQAIRRFMSR